MISEEVARDWAEVFVREAVEQIEYSAVYEDEDFTSEYPDEGDWEKVHDLARTARIEVHFD